MRSLALLATLGAGLLGGCALLAGVEDATLDPSITGGTGGATSTTTATGGNGPGGEGQGAGAQGGAGQGGAGQGGGAQGGGGQGGAQGGGGQGGGGECPAPTTNMLEVPEGPFMMGCNDAVDVQCDSDEDPYHEVTLGCFLIDRYEVSRGDYFACVEEAACDEPLCDWDPSGTALQDHPVTCVTWEMADAYCAWAGKRLPTEAEWERAARGTDGRKYPFGNVWGGGTPSTGDCSQMNGNLCQLDTSVVTAHATGTSPVGAFNMGGNVEEWVADWYDANYYAASPANDPPGPASGGVKVKRGGSWNSAVFDLRTSSRAAEIADGFGDLDRADEVGFRCAK